MIKEHRERAKKVNMPKSTVTLKRIRRWCRRVYGPSWWDCDAALKTERKSEAREALMRI